MRRMELAHIFKEELGSVLRLEAQLLQLPDQRNNFWQNELGNVYNVYYTFYN